MGSGEGETLGSEQQCNLPGGLQGPPVSPIRTPTCTGTLPSALDLPTPAGHGSCSCHAAWHKDALVLLLPGQVFSLAVCDLFMS